MEAETKISSEQGAQIAAQIYNQLGGKRFVAMTGCKPKYYDGATSTYSLTKNKIKAKYMKITLNSMDTYDIQFFKETRTLDAKNSIGTYKAWNYGIELLVEKNGYYGDMLQKMFTDVTGLYTKL